MSSQTARLLLWTLDMVSRCVGEIATDIALSHTPGLVYDGGGDSLCTRGRKSCVAVSQLNNAPTHKRQPTTNPLRPPSMLPHKLAVCTTNLLSGSSGGFSPDKHRPGSVKLWGQSTTGRTTAPVSGPVGVGRYNAPAAAGRRVSSSRSGSREACSSRTRCWSWW